MDRQSCYDVVIDLVSQATELHGEEYRLNHDITQQLKTICNYIEVALKQYECEFFEVNINENTMQLTIAIVCEDMILDKQTSAIFGQIINTVDSFSFSRPEIDSLRVEFKYNHIWEKK